MEAIGQRVATIDDLTTAGDYVLDAVMDHGETKRAVWFLLPIHEGVDLYDRPSEGSGLHMVTEPPWTFRECGDGSVEIRASILCGRTAERPEGYFHGFLNEGHRWSW